MEFVTLRVPFIRLSTMSPPSKRQRSCSDASVAHEEEKANVADEAMDISSPEPHGTLWYEDGNIVLATDAYFYRVHKSILAKQSSVFREMFQVSDGGDSKGDEESKVTIESNSEKYEGVPLVRMVDDKDVDVYNFLLTLYDRK